MIGVPSIFYGDEYGMKNNDGSSRGCFDWQNYQNEIFEWYKHLAKIRKMKVMKDGDLNILYAKHGKFVYERVNDDERVVVLSNMNATTLRINLNGNFTSFISGEPVKTVKLGKYGIEILIETKN